MSKFKELLRFIICTITGYIVGFALGYLPSLIFHTWRMYCIGLLIEIGIIYIILNYKEIINILKRINKI